MPTDTDYRTTVRIAARADAVFDAVTTTCTVAPTSADDSR